MFQYRGNKKNKSWFSGKKYFLVNAFFNVEYIKKKHKKKSIIKSVERLLFRIKSIETPQGCLSLSSFGILQKIKYVNFTAALELQIFSKINK